ncbi:beta-glucosidase [Brachybacterium huguangmaarense]|uniref:Beta-glucosidase n=1 Tax=Brachybacterium huguangmaarense TaxID=1652028 RepID=A0ABY6G339_9MICO|nr:glycoside hydrolase family 3 N-terminal domain-containing protein [Brachybacterium huguangmaarense]UYG17379.1 beta-glucosidase [Brachybacterium huguangmaarense]
MTSDTNPATQGAEALGADGADAGGAGTPGAGTGLAGTWDRDALGVLMAPIEGTTVPEWARGALEGGLASVILFGYNTPSPEAARDLAREIHGISAQALVSIDEEGGDVTRLQAGTGSSLPTAWALGQVDDTALTAEVGAALGGLLHACDLDLALSPVLDVSTDPANPVIGTRAFGATPDLVARHAEAFATGLRSAGVGTCGKHFPGHGATATDSHTDLPRIDLDEHAFRAEHLAPWAIAPRLDAVMTAHILVPALGEGPASISPWSAPLLRDVSRGGFDGLIVTDALDMAAVAADPGVGEAVVRAVEAGADLLCLGTSLRRDDLGMVREAHDALVGAVASGRIRREDLASRALRTREAAGALRRRRRLHGQGDLADALGTLARLGPRAAARAIDIRSAALDGTPVVVVDARGRVDHAARIRPVHLLEALTEKGIDATAAEAVSDLEDDRAVLVVTRLPRADPPEERRLQEVITARPDAIVVHIGVPDAAPAHRHLVLTLGGGLVPMRAAVEALLAAGRTAGATGGSA